MSNGSHLLILWKEIFNSGGFNIGLATSSDGGVTWDSTRYVFERNWAGIQEMAAAGWDSQVVLIIGTQVSYDFVYFVSRSTNFGRTWSVPDTMFACYQSDRPDMAVINSEVHFVWDGAFESDPSWETYSTRSLDGGLTWSENQPLSTIDQHGSLSSVVCLDGPGVAAVAWLEGKYSSHLISGDIFMRISEDSGSTWAPEIQATFNHYALDSDISLRGDTIDVLWQDVSLGLASGYIYYSVSYDRGLNWADPIRLDETDDDSRNPAMAISGGRIFAVWADSRMAPDSTRKGLYFCRWDPEPDWVRDDESENHPNNITLSAYPNPFNSSITIYIGNGEAGKIIIYDITGRQIEILDAKEEKAIWDASAYSSGVYFAKATGKNNSSVIKLVYLK